MNLQSIWSALEESYGVCSDTSAPSIEKFAEGNHLSGGYWSWGPAIILFPDEPISSVQWMKIFPYGIPQTINGRLASAAEGGYLVKDGERFRSTEKGKAAAHQGLQALTDGIADLHPLPPNDLQCLVDYLVRLSDASFAAPDPPPKFCLTHYKNYKSTFDGTAPLNRLFVHYFKELDFYRMDSHMAAWRSHNFEGNRWEVFSEVWGGKNNTLDKIFDELSFRGITREEYASILQELVERGWIQQDGKTYQPTAEGKCLRDEAESLTDEYFFAPWSCLNELELEELASLAGQLRDGLKNLESK
ncbi:MAG: hypothetical protein HY867_02575 [Chloroflexi bacterium]|nr:hypothetical protein [Chloroflexota bacterium]